MAMVSVILVAA